MATFGEKIRNIRFERGLSQESLAALLHTSKQVVSHYELGHRTPKIDMAARYATALDVSVEYLVNDELPVVSAPESLEPIEKTAVPKDSGLSPLDAQLMDYVRRLTDDQKRMLLAQIELLLKTQG